MSNLVFNRIPKNLRSPGFFVEEDSSRAVKGLPGLPRHIVVVGNRLSTGNVIAGEPLSISRAEDAAPAFGEGSMIHQMITAARKVNNWQPMTCIALDDNPAGNAATGKITYSSVDAQAGTLNWLIGADHIQVGVAKSATPETLATNTAAEINKNPMRSVDAAVNGVDTKIVDLTARHKGEYGNDIDIRLNYYVNEKLPAGVGATITPMAGGTANPDVGDALLALGGVWYTDMIVPFTDAANLTKIETELEERSDPLTKKDCQGYAFKAGTHGELTTHGLSRNPRFVSTMGYKKPPTTPWVHAAIYGAVGAFNLAIDPGRPLQTLDLPYVVPPSAADAFTEAERNMLLFAGISTADNNSGVMQIHRAITGYRVNGAGAADTAYLDVNTIALITFLKWSERNRMALRFPRAKLADDGLYIDTAQSGVIATPNIVRDELIALAREWAKAGLIENMEKFIEDVYAERDSGDPNRVNMLNPADLINQFRVYASQIQFIL